MRLRSSKIIGIPTVANRQIVDVENPQQFASSIMFTMVCTGYILYIVVIFCNVFREPDIELPDEKFNLSSILEDMI